MNKFWTDELTEALKTLWAQGLTGSEVARVLGLNRNSVLGKAYRIGLLGFRKPRERLDALRDRLNAPKKGPARRPPVRTSPTPLPKSAAGQSFNGDCGPIYDIMELRLNHCRWPIGDPQDENFCYCGALVDRGPYCPSHARIAYAEPFYRLR